MFTTFLNFCNYFSFITKLCSSSLTSAHAVCEASVPVLDGYLNVFNNSVPALFLVPMSSMRHLFLSWTASLNVVYTSVPALFPVPVPSMKHQCLSWTATSMPTFTPCPLRLPHLTLSTAAAVTRWVSMAMLSFSKHCSDFKGIAHSFLKPFVLHSFIYLTPQAWPNGRGVSTSDAVTCTCWKR